LEHEKKKTAGELLFEEYLSQRGLNFDFEKSRPKKRKKPDYTIVWGGQELLFDVKDFASRDFPEHSGFYDPIGPIRGKIDEAMEKFQEYKGHSCSLVLHNDGAPLVHLSDPLIVLGAMFGNPGFTMPIDTATGMSAGPTERAFLDGAKMIHSRRKKPRLAHISALITIRRINVGAMRLDQYLDGLPKSSDAETSKQAAEMLDHLEGVHLPFDETETAVAVIVWGNAFATIPFPSDLFCGPYDVHWAGANGRVALAYEGAQLRSLKRPQ
jgi:hypothetical protein